MVHTRYSHQVYNLEAQKVLPLGPWLSELGREKWIGGEMDTSESRRGGGKRRRMKGEFANIVTKFSIGSI